MIYNTISVLPSFFIKNPVRAPAITFQPHLPKYDLKTFTSNPNHLKYFFFLGSGNIFWRHERETEFQQSR